MTFLHKLQNPDSSLAVGCEPRLRRRARTGCVHRRAAAAASTEATSTEATSTDAHPLAAVHQLRGVSAVHRRGHRGVLHRRQHVRRRVPVGLRRGLRGRAAPDAARVRQGPRDDPDGRHRGRRGRGVPRRAGVISTDLSPSCRTNLGENAPENVAVFGTIGLTHSNSTIFNAFVVSNTQSHNHSPRMSCSSRCRFRSCSHRPTAPRIAEHRIVKLDVRLPPN